MNHELNELLIKGQLLHSKNQFPEAIQLYEELLKKEPMHQEALHFLGLIYAQLGDMDSALLYLNKAKTIKPEASLFNNLGNAYKKKHQF